MKKECIFQILILNILLSSCEKESGITQEDLLGRWLYTYSAYFCGNVGNPEYYLEEYCNKDSWQMDYDFLDDGTLIETYLINGNIDTLEWAYNELSQRLLIYKEGVFGMQIDETLRMDRINSEELISLKIDINTTSSAVFEYKFKRYE